MPRFSHPRWEAPVLPSTPEGATVFARGEGPTASQIPGGPKGTAAAGAHRTPAPKVPGQGSEQRWAQATRQQPGQPPPWGQGSRKPPGAFISLMQKGK